MTMVEFSASRVRSASMRRSVVPGRGDWRFFGLDGEGRITDGMGRSKGGEGCRGNGASALRDKGLETRVGADGVHVGIFGGPILVEGAVGHDLAEAFNGVVHAAEKRIDAGHIVKNGGFLGFELQGKIGRA